MKVTLFLESQIMDFILPNEVQGSYCFDMDEEEDSKLINIEARTNNWFIYSTDDVKVLNNNEVVKESKLEIDNFYIISRNDKKYLIYISELRDTSLVCYSYKDKKSLIIGNQSDCNIIYKCPFINKEKIIINLNNQQLMTENEEINIYIDKRKVNDKVYTIKNGQQLYILGLKIYFYPNLLFINNPKSRVTINSLETGLQTNSYVKPVSFKQLEIKEEDLYSKEEYFSKKPRFRRIIEEKEIKLDQPPRNNNDDEMPFLLTVGPMVTMGIMSVTTIVNTFLQIHAGQTTYQQAWPQLVTGGAMVLSMLGWPIIINIYGKIHRSHRQKELAEKYDAYLLEKKEEFVKEASLQKNILIENLISIEECIKIIQLKQINFWDKKINQSDFLVVRIGNGNELLKVKVEYPEEGFTIEESELKKKADNLVQEFKYIKDVPIGYSFYQNKITAVMGNKLKTISFINNIILQFVTFYSYDDLKIVLFTSDENEYYFDYVKYLPHVFSDNKDLRFFATNNDDSNKIGEYLNLVVNQRLQLKNSDYNKPYYVILTDDYELIKKSNFIKTISNTEENLGFSVIIIGERLGKLPSDCNNFISIGDKTSGVLKNSYEKQEQIVFNNEIVDVDMMKIAKILANIPIEFDEGSRSLPNSINFLEMEKVGKVEQLNILNRWNVNDSTISLKAEVGVDEENNLMYLDLHEKAHGPHGLIAGMTGSGKSEFIVTYILSMAMNYSPEDVAFILIDYKGGGLAFAFENKMTGTYLPHLAGTITNLDKAEMDRTLVSINSERERRQRIFNLARDELGESTIDIYKYQKFYKEKKLKEPMPHLFIVCDEFAELKSQQPEFMDNLISVARIGRSLGIHLILATQKPSGVVNEQIWSNSKFHICLKVQDESDSREMLKRPDAAALKQTGRFFLQVGYDEYFALGQSAWCGAKYYPSDKIVKKIDKSINFINNTGDYIKNVQEGNNVKIVAQGDQLTAILNQIIATAKLTNKKARRLWLENISDLILVDALEKKYDYTTSLYDIEAVIGEYDAPEKQQQGLVKYNFLDDGNTLIYGIDGSERENLLQTIIYSSIKDHLVEELNYYIIDYGSENLRKFQNLPHIGGMVFADEDEKYNNLIKLIKNKLRIRKKLFSDSGGGVYKNFIKNASEKLPLIVVILNNYDSIYENHDNIYDELPELIRDSERYGIVFIIAGSTINSIHSKITQNCNNIYTFRLKEANDYASLFNTRNKISLRNVVNRGLFMKDGVHEFQTACMCNTDINENEFIKQFEEFVKQKNNGYAESIPILPDNVLFKHVASKIHSLSDVPIGIGKNDLEIKTIDLMSNIGYIISSNHLSNLKPFTKNLLNEIGKIIGKNVIILDGSKDLEDMRTLFSNYYVNNMEENIKQLTDFFNRLASNSNKIHIVVVLFGFNRFFSKITDSSIIVNFMNSLKMYENISVLFIEEFLKLKNYMFEAWYNSMVNNSDGIWIGRGISDQSVIKLSSINKEMTKDYKNNMGFNIVDGVGELCKLIDFNEDWEDDLNEK